MSCIVAHASGAPGRDLLGRRWSLRVLWDSGDALGPLDDRAVRWATRIA